MTMILATSITSCKNDDDRNDETPVMMEDPEAVVGRIWDYGTDGRGPEAWGSLSEDFILCAEGLEQSPIDLTPATIVNQGDASALTFNYKTDAVLLALNNTRTNEFVVDEGSWVTFNGTAYQLAQFHGHAASEHTIDGEQAPLELHFVHVSEAGELLVVGVLIEEGAANLSYDTFWTPENFLELDDENEEEDRLVSGTHDLTQLFPQDSPLYQYDGSLTTPPCSEGVAWNVLTETITMSAAQIELFTDIFDNNYRPTQELNGRDVISTDTPVVSAL